MRNRDYKEFAPGTYYHVYNRGVAKQDIFVDEQDYIFFLYRLKENLFPEIQKDASLSMDDILFNSKKSNDRRKLLPPNSFEMVCYCLMPNHFHFLIKQLKNVPISSLMLKIGTGYSMYFNKKQGRVGALFQDAFKAIPIEDNNYLFWLSLYIHKNPIEAGLVDDIKKWRWSSYLDYIGERNGILCEKSVILEQLNTVKNYEKMIDKDIKKQKEFKKLSNLTFEG